MTTEIDIIAADLELYTRAEIVRLTLNIDANLRESPPLGTPVDTGWAKANWIPSIGSPNLTASDVRDPSPGDIAARAEVSQKGLNEVLGWKPADGPIFITNNVPYIAALNAGHSGQSPAGFVQNAIEVAIRQTKASAALKGARNRRAAASRQTKRRPT